MTVKDVKKTMCPYCEKEFSTRGLSGHILFIHGKNMDGETVKVPVSPEVDNILRLSKQIREINREIAEIKNNYNGDLNGYRSEARVVTAGLKSRKLEMIDEMKESLPEDLLDELENLADNEDEVLSVVFPKDDVWMLQQIIENLEEYEETECDESGLILALVREACYGSDSLADKIRSSWVEFIEDLNSDK